MGLMLHLDVAGRPVAAVGAGPAGREKVARLLAAGAEVVVVDPSRLPTVWGPAVTVVPRAFRADDVAGAVLVVAATDDGQVNDQIARAALAAGAVVVRADRADGGGVAFAAVLERGPLRVGVATGGISPLLARWLRDRIAAVVTPAVGDLASMVARRPRSAGRRGHRSLPPRRGARACRVGGLGRRSGVARGHGRERVDRAATHELTKAWTMDGSPPAW